MQAMLTFSAMNLRKLATWTWQDAWLDLTLHGCLSQSFMNILLIGAEGALALGGLVGQMGPHRSGSDEEAHCPSPGKQAHGVEISLFPTISNHKMTK